MNRDLAAVTAVGPICLDELVTVLAEYPTDHRWNGWICPNLDAWSVVKVAEALDRAYADGTDQRGPVIEFVDGDLVVTEYDGDEAFPETIPADASGFYSLGAYAWTWSEDRDAVRMAATGEFVELVRAIGPGFHPDIPGDDYLSLPDEWDGDRIDDVIEHALACDVDVYRVALTVVSDMVNPTGDPMGVSA